MRGRNVEDIGDLEEKGLLRSEKGTLHKVEEDKYEPGLKSKRDRHAFALLVVLCMSLVDRADTRFVTGRAPGLDVRHAAVPPQAEVVVLEASHLCAVLMALLAQVAVESHRRRVFPP